MTKQTKNIIIITILMILVALFNQWVGAEVYKDNCEVVGNSQGQKWRECDL